MLWVLKRTVSMRRFFWAPKYLLKLMGKKIFTIYAENFCLSKPVIVYIFIPRDEEFAEGDQRPTDQHLPQHPVANNSQLFVGRNPFLDVRLLLLFSCKCIYIVKLLLLHRWASTWENLSSGVSEQQRLRILPVWSAPLLFPFLDLDTSDISIF